MHFENAEKSSKNSNDWTWHFSVLRLCLWHYHDNVCMFKRSRRWTIAWNASNEMKIETKWFCCRWSVEKSDKWRKIQIHRKLKVFIHQLVCFSRFWWNAAINLWSIHHLNTQFRWWLMWLLNEDRWQLNDVRWKIS